MPQMIFLGVLLERGLLLKRQRSDGLHMPCVRAWNCSPLILLLVHQLIHYLSTSKLQLGLGTKGNIKQKRVL